jgi:hypothetical protein
MPLSKFIEKILLFVAGALFGALVGGFSSHVLVPLMIATLIAYGFLFLKQRVFPLWRRLHDPLDGVERMV